MNNIFISANGRHERSFHTLPNVRSILANKGTRFVFAAVYLSTGTLPKNRGEKGHYWTASWKGKGNLADSPNKWQSIPVGSSGRKTLGTPNGKPTWEMGMPSSLQRAPFGITKRLGFPTHLTHPPAPPAASRIGLWPLLP